jgi:hypothetical protein
MKNLRKQKILISIFAVWMISMACSLPLLSKKQISKADPTPTPTQIVVITPESDLPLTSKLPQKGEQFSYKATEAQLTKLIGDALVARPEYGISNPQVYLRDGIVKVTADYAQSGLNLPLNIELRLYIDAQHHLQYEIVTATIGPFPLPEQILDQISLYLDEAITNNTDLNMEDIIFEQVSVEYGVITINGYIP